MEGAPSAAGRRGALRNSPALLFPAGPPGTTPSLGPRLGSRPLSAVKRSGWLIVVTSDSVPAARDLPE